jgi:hypothetical protein
MNEQISGIIKIQSVVMFDTYGIFIHMFFMTVGLAILAFMTFKSDKIRILWLMILLSLLGIFLSKNGVYIFFLFSSIYLAFIMLHFIGNYIKNKQKKTLLTAAGFLFLLLGNIHFLFSVNHQLFYTIGLVFELVAYLLILVNLYLVLNK